MNAIVDDLAELRDATAKRFAAAGLCGAGPIGRPLPTGALSCMHYKGDFAACPAPARNGAQATYDGTLAATLLDRELVSAILPPRVCLAETKDPAWTLHPVLCLMGRQNDPRRLSGGQPEPIPLAKPYNELILLIPYTVCCGKDRWHSFAARMYLDDLAATLIGDIAYAYAKLIGEFALAGSSAEVVTDGDTVFEIEADAQGDDDDGSAPASPWMSDPVARQKLLGYPDLCQVLGMPIVGYSGLYGYRRSYFEFNFDNADIASTCCLLRFQQPLRPGMQAWPAMGYLMSAPQAAFKVRKVQWRLSIKFPVQDFDT